jgi:hypothetical protein
MIEERDVFYTATDPRSLLRIAIGLAVMLALVLTSAWMGWVMAGFPANGSPLQWWNQSAEFWHLVILGAVFGSFGLGFLWIIGLFAFAIGDVLIAKWRKGKRSHS